MIATIFWELRRRRTALIWWTIGSILMTVTILALFPSIQDKAAQMNQVINQLPEGIREMKAGGVGSVDVGDPAQFLNSQLFYITLPMIWIILAITRGAAILGREEQDGTLEMLLARPLSRTRLLLAKAAELFFGNAHCRSGHCHTHRSAGTPFQIRRRGHQLSCDYYTSNVSF